jgi:transmembrane sensor
VDQNPSHIVRLHYLFQLALERKITPAQRRELLGMLADAAYEVEVQKLLGGAWTNFESDETILCQEDGTRILNSVLSNTLTREDAGEERPLRFFSFWRVAVAASVIILLSVGAYFTLVRDNTPLIINKDIKNDVPPGGNKALLTLANGRVIRLEDAPVGLLVNQGAFKISKSADGSVVYENNRNEELVLDHQQEFNIISTPKGGKYKVILPDGSKVWLNAASSLKYPTRFSSEERTVQLTGEAYMEINTVYNRVNRRSVKKPFRVVSGHQLVEVLGTHFNINNYNEEKIAKTTLFEGSIKVSDTGRRNSRKISPGEQCFLSPTGELKVLHQADLQEAVAWKDDIFRFNDTDIASIMRQISRWYNVDVRYQGEVPKDHLTGYISQKVPVSSVLKMLEETSGLTFTIRGRHVIVNSAKNR